MSEALLTIQNLEAWYGESHALHGVGLEVREGEVVTLLGRNGAGKTTTMKSIMGLVPRREGSIPSRAPRPPPCARTAWPALESPSARRSAASSRR